MNERNRNKYVGKQSKEIHRKLFKLGYSNTSGEIESTDPFIYISKGEFEYGRHLDVFCKESETEVTPQQILDFEPVVEFKTGDEVLVRSSDCNEWQYLIFSHYSGSLNAPFYAGSIRWQYCIPYKGNEHLVGKIDNK